MKTEFCNKHWFMYTKLEEEFLEIEKIIPIDSNNFKTFSYSYMQLLESICSELTDCFKNFVKFNGDTADSINGYMAFIKDNYPTFIVSKIIFSKLGCETQFLEPFIGWNTDENLFWWETNNNLKHSRNNINSEGIENYKLANQYCILNALSGLFQLNMYFYKHIVEKENNSKHFIFQLPSSEIFQLADLREL